MENKTTIEMFAKIFNDIKFINCKDRQPTKSQLYFAIFYDEKDKDEPFFCGVAEFYNGEWYEDYKVIAWVDEEERECIG